MRLLNTRSIKLEELEKPIPAYAILSHTWMEGEEVTYEDLKFGRITKPGYNKIWQTCRIALDSGVNYAWVDTCCIDKSNMQELSEAINSMFRYYEEAKVCYAYLADVDPFLGRPQDLIARDGPSRWFRRGWTLQELLAPSDLVFFASDWSPIGTRQDLSHRIEAITNINKDYLVRSPPNVNINNLLGKASVAERMSWASKRETKRVEDVAYCLLGIFGLNMPLIYGEGKNAFIRLQEEIARRSDDQSLFAWNQNRNWQSLLAESPDSFAGASSIIPQRTGYLTTKFSITNKGIMIRLPILPHKYSTRVVHALLECRPRNDPSSMVVIELLRHGDVYLRAPYRLPGLVDHNAWYQWEKRKICLSSSESQFSDRPLWGHSYDLPLPYSIKPSSQDIVVESSPAAWKDSQGTIPQPGPGLFLRVVEKLVGMRPTIIVQLVVTYILFDNWFYMLSSALAILYHLDFLSKEEVQHVEFLLQIQTPKTPTIVILSLTKRKTRHNRIRCQVSLRLENDKSNSTTPGRFLDLPDGRILCASSNLKRIFGQDIVEVDVLFHSNWVDMRILRLLEVLQNLIPSRPDYTGYQISVFWCILMTLPAFVMLLRLARSEGFYSELARNICQVLFPGVEYLNLSDALIALPLCWRIHNFYLLITVVNNFLRQQLLYEPRYNDRNEESDDLIEMALPSLLVCLACVDMRSGLDGLFWGSILIITCTFCYRVMSLIWVKNF